MNVHFVIPQQFSDQLASLQSIRLGENYPYWLGGRFNWAAQSYLVLRQWREGVTISSAARPEMINFAHCMSWRGAGGRRGEYRISVRADYPRLFDVDFEILQNPITPRCARQVYLPYWPVPGIMPREPSRRGIKTVAYAGRVGQRNLAPQLKPDVLKGVNLTLVRPDRWHDLSRIDLLIAIRDFCGRAHNDKPASKLFNAWIAGIPLIGGADSAFSAIGRPGVDYVRVTTEEEFNAAVERLRSDCSFYEAIVDAGRQRAAEFSHDAIASVWLEAFEGPVRLDFERWLCGSRTYRSSVVPRLLDKGRDALSSIKRRI